MEITDLKTNDFFETHSGEKFQLIEKRLLGTKKIVKLIKRCSNSAEYNLSEFDKVAIFIKNNSK